MTIVGHVGVSRAALTEGDASTDSPPDPVSSASSGLPGPTPQAASPARASISSYVPGEIIVRTRSGGSGGSAASLLPGSRSLKSFRHLRGLELLELPAQLSVSAAITQLQRNPIVLYAEPNMTFTRQDTFPNDPDFGLLWGMHNTGQSGGTVDVDIDAPAAWDSVTGSEDVIVGVIDTGVNYNHPDLAANMWTNPREIAGNGIDDDDNGYIDDVHGIDTVNGDSDPNDDNGHGSHCSGTIAGRGDNGTGVAGVSWRAQIIGCKFLSSGGSGSTAGAIECLDYFLGLKAAGIDVVATSNSWGGGGFSQALLDAIAAHRDANMLFVAAAGNNGANADVSPMYPAAYDVDNILSVAAINRLGNLASFSNYGLTSVDLGAPGVDVYSTWLGTGYNTISGTSMACPHVTGAVALLKASDPMLTGAEIRAQIMANGKPLASLDGKTVTGNLLLALATPPPDADGDGMPDEWELLHGLDPNDASDAALDPDADGLSNLEEYKKLTDPNHADSDADGLLDGEEVNLYGTDPNNADTDGDGLSDGAEVITHGTDPRDADSDNDRLNDGEEINLYGTDPNNADTDGDTFDDGIEVRLGTDPLDPNDYPDFVPLRVGLAFAVVNNTWAADVQESLLSTGLVSEVVWLDVYNSTPSVAELLSFDAIMVTGWNWFLDRNAFGNNVADYHDAGGAVVATTFAMDSGGGGWDLGGRWDTDGYSPLNDGPYVLDLPSVMVIDDATHAIMEGVSSFDGGGHSYRHTTDIAVGASQQAHWSDDNPLVVVKEVGDHPIVALNFFPVSSNVESGFWQANTDGARLMANALRYAAGGLPSGPIPPVPDFGFSCDGLSCAFIDQSSDANGSIASWSWDFGDGGTANVQNPSHAYVTTGVYQVTLTVVDSEGLSASLTQAVAITLPPVAAFAVSCNELSCSFTDQSSDADGTIVGWSWSFGDGGSATAQNPSHTYPASGTYLVTLTVIDNDGLSAEASAEVTVSASRVCEQAAAFADDFENGLGQFTTTGITVTSILASGPGGTGSYGANIDGIGSLVSRTIDTTGFSDMTLQYWMAGNGYDSGEYARVDYCVGNCGVEANWVNLVTVNSADPWTFYSHTLPAAAEGITTLQLRWVAQTWGWFEWTRIDDIELLGTKCVEVECRIDVDCDDGLFCNGAETCDGISCVAGVPPCGQGACDEETDSCLPVCNDALLIDENFGDALLGDFTPYGWVTIGLTAGAHPEAADFYGVAIDGPGNIRSAAVDASLASGMQLSFWMRSNGQVSGEQAVVDYCIGGCDDEANWAALASQPVASDWIFYALDLPAAAEGATALSLRWSSEMGAGFGKWVHVDDIKLSATVCE